ncbi:hypothetical protein ABE322_29710 [Priestia megaterium]
MPNSIIFNTIAVNAQETNAGLFIGQNNANGWDSHNKNIFSIGLILGAFNTFPANYNFILDNDFIDTPIQANELNPSPANQV